MPPLKDLKSEPVFYSARIDGLGERLKSLLNAMVLAKFYKGDFKFTWKNLDGLDNTHAVKHPADTFSAHFLEKHLVDEIPSKILDLEKKIDFFDKTINSTESFKVSQNSIYKQIPALRNYISKNRYEQAFKSISFTDEVNTAIELAKEIDLADGSVAIHLRSGDIIYGRYRFSDRYTNKVISYATADFVLTELAKVNKKVVIFGQTNSVCSYLAKKFNAIYPEEMDSYQKLNQLQKAMFDIVLMSRTSNIFSGNSGFAQLAEIIGNTKISSVEKIFPKEDIFLHTSTLLFSNEVKNYDLFQTAFSHWHLYYWNKSIIEADVAINHLSQASKLDPQNLFYKVILATLYFENKKNREAEDLIKEILETRKENRERFSSYSYLKNYKYPDKSGAFKNYKNKLRDMAKSNLKNANILAKDLAQ